MEAGPCRRPYCIIGKPDHAGCPLQGSTYMWKPVYAGGLIVCVREARRSERPGVKYTVSYMEACPCWRPHWIQLGNQTMRGATCNDLHTYGSRSMPGAISCVQGKPDRAGGPVINTLYDTWKLVHVGGHIVCNWEARHYGWPTRRIYINVDAGQCRRPCCVYKGSPTNWDAR